MYALLAELFPYSYESDFLQWILPKKKEEIIIFPSLFIYLDEAVRISSNYLEPLFDLFIIRAKLNKQALLQRKRRVYCDRLLVDSFEYSDEAGFVQGLIQRKEKNVLFSRSSRLVGIFGRGWFSIGTNRKKKEEMTCIVLSFQPNSSDILTRLI